MSNGNDFNTSKEIGDEGAKKVLPFLQRSGVCWRQLSIYGGTVLKRLAYEQICPRLPEIVSVEEDEMYQNLYDIDWQVKLDCKGCSLLKDADPNVTQSHEVKRCLGTHGKDEKKESYQNFVVETVSNNRLYDKNAWKKACWNPITHQWERIRDGVGWWKKRDEVQPSDKDGNPIGKPFKDKKADWYHFLLEFGSSRIEATDEEKQAFYDACKKDKDALLLVRWPVDYCLSITGKHLERIISEGGYKEIDIQKGKSYLIPVMDILKAYCYGKPDEEKPEWKQSKKAIFYDRQNVKVNFADTEAFLNSKGEKAFKNPGSIIYIPERFFKEMGFEVTTTTIALETYTLVNIEIPEVQIVKVAKMPKNGSQLEDWPATGWEPISDPSDAASKGFQAERYRQNLLEFPVFQMFLQF